MVRRAGVYPGTPAGLSASLRRVAGSRRTADQRAPAASCIPSVAKVLDTQPQGRMDPLRCLGNRRHRISSCNRSADSVRAFSSSSLAVVGLVRRFHRACLLPLGRTSPEGRAKWWTCCTEGFSRRRSGRVAPPLHALGGPALLPGWTTQPGPKSR